MALGPGHRVSTELPDGAAGPNSESIGSLDVTGRWEWDPWLYAGSAPFYPVGRLPYPSDVAEVLGREPALDGTGRLLDLGCGPGSLTLLLGPHVAEAVGVDADAGMIDEADRTASDEDEVLALAGFEGPRRLEVPGGHLFAPSKDEVVASVCSLSSAAPHLFGDRLDAFDRDLRELLRGVSPTREYRERSAEIGLSVWRKPSDGVVGASAQSRTTGSGRSNGRLRSAPG